MVCQVVYATTAGATLIGTAATPMAQSSHLASLQTMPAVTATFSAPSFDKPEWYQKQVQAEQAQAAAQQAASKPAAKPTSGRVVTYAISTKGITSANLAEFSSQVNQSLNDSRGWSQLGVSFKEVTSGGNFSLILSEAALVPSFSSGCDTEWSCRVGSSVIINDNRWRGASEAWNAAGGSLRDYRHMVINHEVGHWLGHGHLGCTGAGQPAPVMQQQSISLDGCAFNPWPLASELWSSQLGIQ